jgi:hypothetical protein
MTALRHDERPCRRRRAALTPSQDVQAPGMRGGEVEVVTVLVAGERAAPGSG